MNSPKKGRRKKEVVAEKVILRKKKKLGNFILFSLAMLCQKEKIVIHIGNIRTFNIKVFQNIINLNIQSILNIHWFE
jgi:hypothetical protein